MATWRAFMRDRGVEATVSQTLGTESTTFPASNLNNQHPDQIWKAGGTGSVTFRFTWSSSVTIGGIGIANHNLAGETVTVESGSVLSSVTIPTGDCVLLKTGGTDVNVGTTTDIAFSSLTTTQYIGAISLFPQTDAAPDFTEGMIREGLAINTEWNRTQQRTAGGAPFWQTWGAARKTYELTAGAAAHQSAGDSGFDLSDAFQTYADRAGWITTDDWTTAGTPAAYGVFVPAMRRVIPYASGRSNMSFVLQTLEY